MGPLSARRAAPALLLAFALAELQAAESAAAPAAGEDWPSFRGDSQMRGVAPLARPLAQPRFLWTNDLQEPIEATAAIAQSRAFVATKDGTIAAVALADGKTVWKRKLDGSGFDASPLWHAGRIYLGDVLGVFRALDAADGRELWQYSTEAEIHSSANTDGKRLVFGSYDSHLHCLSLADGKLLWKFQTDGQVHSPSAIAGGRTFVSGCDQRFRSVDLESGKEVGQCEMGGYTTAAPALRGQRAYVGTHGCQVIAIDLAAAKVLWTYESEKSKLPFAASCAAGETRIIAAGRDRAVRALDAENGKELWSFPTRGQVDGSPVLVGEQVVFGSRDGNLYLLAAADGKELWRHTIGARISASPAVGAGRLVIGDEDGKLHAFALSEELR